MEMPRLSLACLFASDYATCLLTFVFFAVLATYALGVLVYITFVFECICFCYKADNQYKKMMV